ncbi:NmrA-like domain-containing protein [Auriculariales sp. MPI-PUGE-AT-0066]|nr:NmrA-like domain-containing protein [Auriculariales sp. MPI-PUGE-AT-0066]
MMIEAAEAGGAKRIIWSGLPSLATASGGKYPHVYHFEGKAQVTEWGRAKFASTDVAFVNVDSGCYAQNMTSHWLIYKRNPLTFALHTPLSMMLPIIDIRDYGRFVLEAVQHPFYATGGEINAAAEWVTAEQIVKDVSNGLKKVTKEPSQQLKEHCVRSNSRRS